MSRAYVHARNILLSELSPRRYYAQIKGKYHHILLGGSLDALTTLIALSVFSLNELNPLINHLIPHHVYFVPFVLVEMAFLRYVVVSAVFRSTKYLNFAVFFTLYTLPIWNTANMLYVHFN